MIVLGFLLLVGCSSAAVASATDEGCGPACAGTCVGGNCLFDTDGLAAYGPLAPTAAGLGVGAPAFIGGIDDRAWAREAASPSIDYNPLRSIQSEHGFQSESVLENKAQELSYELHRAVAHEALLQGQNAKLRQQLERWKETGTNIAQREAKVAALLGASSSQVKAASATATLAAASPAAQPPSMLQQAAKHLWARADMSHSAYGTFFMAMCILAVAACVWKTWCFVQRLRKGDTGFSQAFACYPGSSQRLQPVLRAMGLAQYKVEISEIHLGSLFAGSSDIRVNFRMGSGMECRTKVLENSDGTFLRFDDVLELSVCSSDAPCTICITDRRGDLAHVELPASELVRLAIRPHLEYFRTELKASRALGDVIDRHPYIAMRMRNIIATPTTVGAGLGGKGRATNEQRAYGSFAV